MKSTRVLPPKPWLALGVLPPEFKEGWAKHSWVGDRAHFFRRSENLDINGYWLTTLCGMEAAESQQFPLLNMGTWPKCTRCSQLAPRDPA